MTPRPFRPAAVVGPVPTGVSGARSALAAIIVGVGLAAVSVAFVPLPLPASALPNGPLRQVVAAAIATGRSSARVGITLVPGPVFGVRPPSVTGVGLFDFASGRGRVQLREASGTETLRFVPEAFYVREPPSRGPSGLPVGKSWIAVGLAEVPGPGSSIPQFVDQAEAVNPALVLAELARGARTAKPTAHSTGSSSPEYAVAVDLRRAASTTAGPATAAFVRAVGDQISAVARGTGGAAVMELKVQLGGGGRVTRVEFSPPGSGIGRVALAFSDAVPTRALQVARPPASETVDIAAITAGGEQESGLGDVA